MPNTDQPNFDDEFEQAVAEWRERHNLDEDDAVLLLIELFHIHQLHWDELRRRELPSFEQFRTDITKLVETSRDIQQHAAGLKERLQGLATAPRPSSVTRTAAWLAALAGSLAGYLLGKAWP